MNDNIRRMNIKEFRELGFLQEANRHFFHPLGLALEVVSELCPECGGHSEDDDPCEACDGGGYIERLGGVWDYRDDPEGVTFSENMLSREKASNVREQFCRLLKERNWMFAVKDGVQPLPKES